MGQLSWMLMSDKCCLSVCVYIHHTLAVAYHILTSHVLFYPLYPVVTMLYTDDIFVSIHIFQTAHLRMWTRHSMPKPQNIQLCLYKQFHDISMYCISNDFDHKLYKDNCLIYEKIVLQHDITLFCSCCCKYTHRNCSGLSKAPYEYVRFDTSWYFKKGKGKLFFSITLAMRLENDNCNTSKLRYHS